MTRGGEDGRGSRSYSSNNSNNTNDENCELPEKHKWVAMAGAIMLEFSYVIVACVIAKSPNEIEV